MIKTVGDLIDELSKFDSKLPVGAETEVWDGLFPSYQAGSIDRVELTNTTLFNKPTVVLEVSKS